MKYRTSKKGRLAVIYSDLPRADIFRRSSNVLELFFEAKENEIKTDRPPENPRPQDFTTTTATLFLWTSQHHLVEADILQDNITNIAQRHFEEKVTRWVTAQR